jgi:hypothetical protein
MLAPPTLDIDLAAFSADPYPDLKRMRALAPLCHVPQLGAVLMTRRNDIFENEKKIGVFSSDQPQGLMTRLMGQNMMRKDGAAHQAERQAIFPAVSPRTVRDVWRAQFQAAADALFDELAPRGRACLRRDVATRLSGEALKAITGLTQIPWAEMDRVSQGMMDGIANYTGDPEVEARCNACTAAIDRHIDDRMPALQAAPDLSLLSVQMQAGLPEAQIRANIKLAISGGQNEPRDVIAGLGWAVLAHPHIRAALAGGGLTWAAAFEEYCRWIAPVAMSPRRVAQAHDLHGFRLDPETRVFLMFGSGNRDETVFARPDVFDPWQDASAALSFGAGPHFCAGAWAARCLIADVAMPALFARLPGLRLAGDVAFHGWAFRGPLAVPVEWDA